MRTTLDLDDDVLQAARELGAREKVTLGRMLSFLARRGLATQGSVSDTTHMRGGVPVFAPRGEVVTLEKVSKLMDEEGL